MIFVLLLNDPRVVPRAVFLCVLLIVLLQSPVSFEHGFGQYLLCCAAVVHRQQEAVVVPHPLADLLLRYARQAHCAADADGDRLGREAHLRGGQGGG